MEIPEFRPKSASQRESCNFDGKVNQNLILLCNIKELRDNSSMKNKSLVNNSILQLIIIVINGNHPKHITF